MKKGFTLIELLAVIVILAIIALIAVPIVINIINDAKNESTERSLDLYIDQVEKTIVKENLKRTYNPSYCEITREGKIICYGSDGSALKTDNINNSLDIDVKGEKPIGGVIIVNNNINNIYYINVVINGNSYSRDDSGKKTKKNNTSTVENNAICTPITNEASTEAGSEYVCKVNNNKLFKFYVLSSNSEDSTVNLIMAQNICENGKTDNNKSCKYKWSDETGDLSRENKKGPIVAMGVIYNATKDWTNIPDMIMNYEDINHKYNSSYGYKGIFTDPSTKRTVIVENDEITEYELTDGSVPLKARLVGVENDFSNISGDCFGRDVEDVCQPWFENFNIQWTIGSSSNNDAGLVDKLFQSIDVQEYEFIYPVITVPTSALGN